MKHFTRISICLAVLAAFTLAAVPDRATADEAKSHLLYLKPGGSKILEIGNVSKDIKILISDEEIVHARPLKEDQMYIRGKKIGYCTVTVWDNVTKQATAEIDVTVSYDLAGLKKQISVHFPNQDISVYGADDGIVLSGTVSGPEIVEQVIRLTERFLPTHSGTSMISGGEGGIGQAKGDGGDKDEDEGTLSETGKTSTNVSRITNLLNVSTIHQVLLEVKIAEVIRDSSMDWSAGISYKKFGKDFGAIIGNTPIANPLTTGAPGGGAVFTNFFTGSVNNTLQSLANIALKLDNVNLALEFLEGEGMANTLAEPRLVALSGQEAQFLAGGKFPYISEAGQDNNGNSTSKVEFEEFGVALKFTPIVQSNGLITLKVAPTISEITELVESPAGMLPVVDTRQLETTAQLHDGQTLVLAGLLRNDVIDSLNKVPLLGDVPVLGALFRSSAYQNKKSELMIAITPHLATPVREGLISYPGEFIKPPGRFDFYLMGKLEGTRSANDVSRISTHNFTRQTQGGMEGSHGQLEK